MHSPLPDASALEAGIIEDPQPSRLSRVHDNVRNLLRASIGGASILSSPPTTPPRQQPPIHHGLPTPPQSPGAHRTPHQRPRPEGRIPSPSAESTENASPSPPPPPAAEIREGPDVLFAPANDGLQTQPAATYESAVFSSHAVAALDHPDLSGPPAAMYTQQKDEERRHRAWKRERRGGRGGSKRRVSSTFRTSQVTACVLAALLLAAIVATYVVLATTSSNVSTTFHVLFILGILLATIAFAHSFVRLCLIQSPSHGLKVLVLPTAQPKRHRRRRHQQRSPPTPPLPSDEGATNADFVPVSPIRVHMETDQVRPDSREAAPSAGVHQPPEAWDKNLAAVPAPPPAYGRWRGSVRANPDLLHWQAIPSPVASDAASLPSPAYEEAMEADRTSPPSYVTRDSPARRRQDEHGAEIGQAQTAHRVEPEMVEVRGGGGGGGGGEGSVGLAV